MAAEALISLQDVHKSFGPQQVLRGLSLDVYRGETLCVIGESGCGKSVLLKHMIGLLHPDSGKVTFDGIDLAEAREPEMVALRTRFGIVFQGGALFDSLNVGENVAFPLREHSKLTEDEITKRVTEKLALVGLTGIEEKRVAEISGGMQKRVALARAIALEPEVILYDEPTTGLDPIMADIINQLILRTKQHLMTTSVVVTHDMVSAYKVSDRIVMMHKGEIVIDGTPERIQRTDDELVRQFIEGNADNRIDRASNNGSHQ